MFKHRYWYLHSHVLPSSCAKAEDVRRIKTPRSCKYLTIACKETHTKLKRPLPLLLSTLYITQHDYQHAAIVGERGPTPSAHSLLRRTLLGFAPLRPTQSFPSVCVVIQLSNSSCLCLKSSTPLAKLAAINE